MALRMKLEGLPKLVATLKKLDKIPQASVNKASNAGAQILLKAVRALAPVGETGNLKKGIIKIKEKRRKKGAQIYQIVFSKHWNDKFVKVSKAGKRAYYPASMEYGFLTKNGGYYPGEYFMRRAADDNKNAVRKVMVDVLSDAINKLR